MVVTSSAHDIYYRKLGNCKQYTLLDKHVIEYYSFMFYCLAEGTMFLDFPMDTTANITDTILLTCSASGIPLPDISWYKDGSPLDPSADITESTDGVTMKTSILTLDNLVLTDAGVYSCNASHQNSGTDTRNFTFAVQSKNRLAIK